VNFEADVLGDQARAAGVVDFDAGRALPTLVPVGLLAALDDTVVALDVDTDGIAEHVSRIGRQRDDGQRGGGVDEVGVAGRWAGHLAGGEGARADDGDGADVQGGAVGGRGGRRLGAIERVADDAARLGGAQGDGLRAGVAAAGNGEGGRGGEVEVGEGRRGVGRAGRGLVVVGPAAAGPAIGHVRLLRVEVDAVDEVTAGGAQLDQPAVHIQLKGRVQAAVLLVGPDEQIAAGGDTCAAGQEEAVGCRMPFALRDEAQTPHGDGRCAAVVQFDPGGVVGIGGIEIGGSVTDQDFVDGHVGEGSVGLWRENQPEGCGYDNESGQGTNSR